MTDLKAILEEKGIRKAVVIDDAYDEAPQPDELDDGDWSTFLDDLNEEDHERLSELYPKFEETHQSTLRKSLEFVGILWDNRSKFKGAAVAALFRDYENISKTESDRLETIIQRLKDAGLTCVKAGRDFLGEAHEADVIVIDLFLGRKRSDDDIKLGVGRVRQLVKDRTASPPLIILTSDSNRLDDNRDSFRDEAGLLSSTFRVESKQNLERGGKLESILRRLASHYEDAKRVARFMYAWDECLRDTRESFLRHIRRLDLPDLAQIRTLLLNSEGVRLGDYLLDVADRVLQHEIEGDDRTIEAALGLNNIDLDNYPAPHLTGTPDLQKLVHRMIFAHEGRLRLSEDNGVPNLQFGDVLKEAGESEQVFLVVTPACDLVRDDTEHVMLLPGELVALKPGDWSYGNDNVVRTSIMILSDGKRKRINWNKKAVETRRRSNLIKSLRQGGPLTRIARLRETYAIELQQKILAHLGRIGQPANLPASFPISVSLFYIDTSSKAQKLDIGDAEPASCYVGRTKESKSVQHLVLTEQTCDCIEQALQKLNENSVLASVRKGLEAVKRDPGFITKFERGKVEVPLKNRKEFIKPYDKQKFCAAVIRNKTLEEGMSIKAKEYKYSAIIVQVVDTSDEAKIKRVFE